MYIHLLTNSLMSKDENCMQPKISYSTVERVSHLTQMPISRGFEKALLVILDEYETLMKKYRKEIESS